MYVMCDMCDYVCYVMLCVMLLRSWVRRVSDHEQLNDDLRNRSKVWTVQSQVEFQNFRDQLILINFRINIFLSELFLSKF